MSRIHPADQNRCHDHLLIKGSVDAHHHPSPSVLTVWKRSSMTFQGTDGFTVFDHRGRLTFRVDNYSRKNRCVTGGGGLVLMDGAGKALLTLKPQVLSMQCQWNGYRGEDGCGKISCPHSKVFTMRRRSILLSSSSEDIEAEVFMGGGPTNDGRRRMPDFRIEGSFRRRNCKIRSPTGELVAKIARKKVNTTILLSDDVFSLVVQPSFDAELIMAFVIILDRIGHKPFAPILCS